MAGAHLNTPRVVKKFRIRPDYVEGIEILFKQSNKVKKGETARINRQGNPVVEVSRTSLIEEALGNYLEDKLGAEKLSKLAKKHKLNVVANALGA